MLGQSPDALRALPHHDSLVEGAGEEDLLGVRVVEVGQAGDYFLMPEELNLHLFMDKIPHLNILLLSAKQ